MESNAEQLNELGRLRAETLSESRRTPAWAWPVMGLATIAFFAGYELDNKLYGQIAPFVWTAFVFGWTYLVSRANRVKPRVDITPTSVGVWISLLVAANLFVWALSRLFPDYKYLMIGLVFGLYGLIAGTNLSRTQR